MGLRGYPGMMGPKGEAVSKDPCMFLFFNSFPNLFGYTAVLFLR